MRKPTFFILGAPKCGTTALAQFISSHPDVYLSARKEPHFFDANHRDGMHRYLGDHFANWTHETAAGEATPSYLAVPYVAARIRKETPDAKLLVLLRDPVSRAFSSWWMFHARGMEPLSFGAAIAAEEAQIQDGRHPLDLPDAEASWIEHMRKLRAGDPIAVRTYLHTGNYSEHLKRYFECFPRDQVRVIFSHQLRQSPEQTLRNIWDFLGVASDGPLPEFAGINEAVGAPAVPVLRLARRAGLMRVRGLLPAGVKDWIKRQLSRSGDRPELDPETENRLRQYFGPGIQELESLLDTDLSGWR